MKISFPPEWSKHYACLLAYPHRQDLFENYAAVEREFWSFVNALQSIGEKVILCVPESCVQVVRQQFFGDIILAQYSDFWLRDTSCIFTINQQGYLIANCFKFNFWGNKFFLENDDTLSNQISRFFCVLRQEHDWILEGGSIETNGQGVCLTSKQCLLNPNRNPHFSQEQIEKKLQESFGFDTFLWLERGLLNDHTDGHIDTIARFIDERTILCMRPVQDDPNREVLMEIIDQCQHFCDKRGEKFEVKTITSAGRVGDNLPASYLNFYFTPQAIIVPMYEVSYDQQVLAELKELFPYHHIIGSSARNIVKDGGALHCISQQIPQGKFLN